MEYHRYHRMLLVLPTAKDSTKKVRARERESANPKKYNFAFSNMLSTIFLKVEP